MFWLYNRINFSKTYWFLDLTIKQNRDEQDCNIGIFQNFLHPLKWPHTAKGLLVREVIVRLIICPEFWEKF